MHIYNAMFARKHNSFNGALRSIVFSITTNKNVQRILYLKNKYTTEKKRKFN